MTTVLSKISVANFKFLFVSTNLFAFDLKIKISKQVFGKEKSQRQNKNFEPRPHPN